MDKLIFLVPEWVVWGLALLSGAEYFVRYLLDCNAKRNPFKYMLLGKGVAMFVAAAIYIQIDMLKSPPQDLDRAEMVRAMLVLLFGIEASYNWVKIATDEKIRQIIKHIRGA
jgi:hypothetical protein